MTVSSYTLLLDLGLVVGLGIYYLRAHKQSSRPDRWLDAALLALAVGVLAARVGYVVAHWAYFQDRSGEIFQFWLGGLSWHGALIGTLAGLVLAGRCFHLPFSRLADELALVAPMVVVSAALGCLMAGCGYGRSLDASHWLAADMPDLFGVWALRANVPLGVAGWSVLVGLVIWGTRKKLPAGARWSLFLLLFGLGMAQIEALRGDAVPHWGGWRLDVLLDWGLAAVGALVLLLRWVLAAKGTFGNEINPRTDDETGSEC